MSKTPHCALGKAIKRSDNTPTNKNFRRCAPRAAHKQDQISNEIVWSRGLVLTLFKSQTKF